MKVSIDQNELLGPGTDLIISLLGVLLMMIAVNKAKQQAEELRIEQKQIELIDAIASIYRSKKELVSHDSMVFKKFIIPIKGNDSIIVVNELALQKFTFGGNFLFDPDKVDLKDSGKEIIDNVGKELKNKLLDISEIQIHGHADTSATKRYASNIYLAFERANTVFRHFRDSLPINPDVHMMSVASYGDAKPVGRSANWNRDSTNNYNATVDLRSSNRRIELLLTYKLD